MKRPTAPTAPHCPTRSACPHWRQGTACPHELGELAAGTRCRLCADYPCPCRRDRTLTTVEV